MWQEWLTAILGLWVIAVPFIGFTVGGLEWALVTTGIVIAILGFWSASLYSTEPGTMRFRQQ